MKELSTPIAVEPRRPRSRVSDVLEVVVRAGTLAFWAPTLMFDFHRLMLAGWTPEAFQGVFWLLYGEAIVFLAVWAAFAAVQAVVLLSTGGATSPKSVRKRRARRDARVLRLR